MERSSIDWYTRLVYKRRSLFGLWKKEGRPENRWGLFLDDNYAVWVSVVSGLLF